MNPDTVTLDDLVRIADDSRSRKLVVEAIRTAYALGKFDGIVEFTRRQIEVGERARNAAKLQS